MTKTEEKRTRMKKTDSPKTAPALDFKKIRDAITTSSEYGIGCHELDRYDGLFYPIPAIQDENVDLNDGSIIPKYLKNKMMELNRVFNYTRKPRHVIVRGSRGTGKSFFLRSWAKAQLALPRLQGRNLDVRWSVIDAAGNPELITQDDWRIMSIVSKAEREMGIQPVLIIDNLALASIIIKNYPNISVIVECSPVTLSSFLSTVPNQLLSNIELIDLDEAKPTWGELLTYLRDVQDEEFGGSNDGLQGSMVDTFIRAYYKTEETSVKVNDLTEVSISAALSLLEDAHARLMETPSDGELTPRAVRKLAHDMIEHPGNYNLVTEEEQNAEIEALLRDMDIDDDDDDDETWDEEDNATSTHPSKTKHKKPLKYQDVNTLADRLKSKIVNQDEAIDKIVRAVKVSAAGLSPDNRPVGVFLFAGPSGVGKTELARQLANELYDKPAKFVRLDMSEYSERHTVANLYGSPRGYVGSDQGGMLTNVVIEDPQSIILLDEVEKAYPTVWDSMLQVFDAGRMTDSRGMVADFSKSIIIMTSNLGNDRIVKNSSGFASSDTAQVEAAEDRERKALTMDAIKKYFRVELINRIDGIVLFNKLRRDDLVDILSIQIDGLAERLHKSHPGLTLNTELDEATVDWILNQAKTELSGARDLQRTVQNLVTLPMADWLLTGDGVSYDGKLNGAANDMLSVQYNGESAQFQVSKGDK